MQVHFREIVTLWYKVLQVVMQVIMLMTQSSQDALELLV